MDILHIMILCSVSLAAIFLIIFIISAKKGQFEDDESPAVRILMDSEILPDEPPAGASNDTKKEKEKEKKKVIS